MRGWLLSLALTMSAAAQPPILQEMVTPRRPVGLALQYSPDPALAKLQVRLAAAEREATASASRFKLNLGAFGSAQNTAMLYSTGADPNFLQVLPAPEAINVNAMAVVSPLHWGSARTSSGRGRKGRTRRRSEARLDPATANPRCPGGLFRSGRDARAAGQPGTGSGRPCADGVAGPGHRLAKAARYIVLRAEAEQAETLQRRNELAATLQEQEAKLKSLMGVAPESIFTYPESFTMPANPPTLRECLEIAYR